MKYKCVSIGSIAEVVTKGTTPTSIGFSFVKEGIPFLRVNNIQNGKLLNDDILFVDPETDKALARSRIQPEDVLISIAGTIGRTAVVPLDAPAMNCNQAVAMIRLRKDVDPYYVNYWLNTDDAIRQITGSKVTATIANLSLGCIKELKIPLPPIAEQRSIAAILDRADAVRRKRQEAIALTEELLRSAFLEMFGDPVRNSKGWELKPLGKVASVNRGKFTPRPRNDPKYYGGIYPFIQTGDIAAANGYLANYSQTLNDLGIGVSRSFSPGSIVIAIVGATIGETAILAKEMYCPDSVVGIEPHSELCSEYVEYSLRWWKDIFRARAPETARANINLETIRPLSIALPPMTTQKVFREIYQRVYTEISQDKLIVYDDLFNSLLQRAFWGEL
ncbi:MAG TPA: restriction endonuclease subunit S [Coleofasciculaceae cyanobacterium]|jgi:type I restriction enzyme S subunit